jgi:plasmid replication initiation protein
LIKNKIDEKNLIVKKNKLIESKYNMTTLELKLIIVALSRIKKGDTNFFKTQIKVLEFSDLVGTNETSIYKNIKKACESLSSKTLKIYNDKNFEIYTWIKHIKYYSSEGSLEIEFNELLAPYLLLIKDNFTAYMLKDIIHLKSKYSIRIYELLKQYEKIGYRVIELNHFKDLLCINGSYSKYGLLKNRVLEPAKNELKKCSDIEFTYTAIKEGRKIVSVRFNIFKSDNKQDEEDYKKYDKFKLIGMIQKEFFKKFNINLHHVDFVSKHRIILIGILQRLFGTDPKKIKFPERYLFSLIDDVTNCYDISKLKKLMDY